MKSVIKEKKSFGSFSASVKKCSENGSLGKVKLYIDDARGDIKWFSTIQAAQYLDLSPQALLNMTSCGKVPYYKLNRRNRYKKSDLDFLLEKNRRGPKYGN